MNKIIIIVCSLCCLSLSNHWCIDLLDRHIMVCANSIFFSKRISNKKHDGSKSTNHCSLAWPFKLIAHFDRSDIKQTPVCIVCDLLISNSTPKGECQSTESGYKDPDWWSLCSSRKYPILPPQKVFVCSPPPPRKFQFIFIHCFQIFSLKTPPPLGIPMTFHRVSIGFLWNYKFSQDENFQPACCRRSAGSFQGQYSVKFHTGRLKRQNFKKNSVELNWNFQGPVVQRPANANLGLKVNQSLFLLLKSVLTANFELQFENSQSLTLRRNKFTTKPWGVELSRRSNQKPSIGEVWMFYGITHGLFNERPGKHFVHVST